MVPLEDKRVETVMEALIFQVLMKYGVTEVLYSDKGTEFWNLMMRKIAKYSSTMQSVKAPLEAEKW